MVFNYLAATFPQLSTRIRVQLYAGLLAGATAALAIWVAMSYGRPTGSLWALALLAVFAVVAETQPVKIAPNTEITVAMLPILFAAMVYGPGAAMLVGAVGLLIEFRPPYVRWVLWTSTRCLAAGLAGVVASALFQPHGGTGLLVAAVVAASTAEALADAFLGAGVVVARNGGGYWKHVRSLRPVLLATIPLYAPLVAILVFAYNSVSPWAALMFFGPAFAAQRFYRLYQQQRDVAQQLTAANDQLEQANLSFASALVATLDARDRYTAGHSAAVAIYARDIAARMGLREEAQQKVHLCGLVHDIGKIGLSPGLLEKPGSLTLDERRHMEEHSIIGERILRNVQDYAEIAEIVRHHHERVDGNGYPDRLDGEAIPQLSRIIAVADAYNAMTSDRPYRDAMPSRVARLRLAQAVETQFDTSVVAAFEAILAGADETYRTGTRGDFTIDATDVKLLRLVEVA